MIASLWVVAIQLRATLTIVEFSSVTSSWSESSLKCSTAFNASFQKKTRKRALASQLSRGERVQALAGEKREKMLGGNDREEKIQDT